MSGKWPKGWFFGHLLVLYKLGKLWHTENSHLGAKNVITLVQLRERDKVYKAQTGPIFLDLFCGSYGSKLGPIPMLTK